MPQSVSFFTPITYCNQERTFGRRLVGAAEGLLGFSRAKAYVPKDPQKVILRPAERRVWATIAKVALCAILLPLTFAALITKAIFRASHRFQAISDRELLGKGVTVDQPTITKVQSVMKQVLKEKPSEGIHYYKSQGGHRVFTLNSAADLVFKMEPANNEEVNKRYQKMLDTKVLCEMYGLKYLVVPPAVKFDVTHEGKTYRVIAEKKGDINPEGSAQEKLYSEHAKSLEKAVRELTLLTCKMGFDDVEWRNFPILNNSQDPEGNRKLYLIDIEGTGDPDSGLFGNGYLRRRGLVGLVNEKLGKAVIEEAKKHLPWMKLRQQCAEDALSRRKEENEEGVKLQGFYAKKGITTGREPIQVNLDSLGLELDEEGSYSQLVGVKNGKLAFEPRTVTLRKAAEDIIAQINTLIQKSSEGKTVKGKRYILLNTNESPFMHYLKLGLSRSVGIVITYEEEKRIWINRVVNALVAKGHLFKLEKNNGHGFFIQA